LPPGLPRAQLELLDRLHSERIRAERDVEIKRKRDDDELTENFRTWVGLFGGADALRSALGRQPNYLQKINAAMLGKKGKPIHAKWITILRRDPRSGPAVREYERRQAEEQLPEFDLEGLDGDVAALVFASPHLVRSLLPDLAARRRVPSEHLDRWKRAVEEKLQLLRGWLDR
jgi:hypothetical protein